MALAPCPLDCAAPGAARRAPSHRLAWALLASGLVAVAWFVLMSVVAHPAGAAGVRLAGGQPGRTTTAPSLSTTSLPVSLPVHVTASGPTGPFAPVGGLAGAGRSLTSPALTSLTPTLTTVGTAVSPSLSALGAGVGDTRGPAASTSLAEPGAPLGSSAALLGAQRLLVNPLLSSGTAALSTTSSPPRSPSPPTVPAPSLPRAPGVSLTAGSVAHGVASALRALGLLLLASGLVFALRRRPQLLLDLRSAPPG
jgi:hypothetical protein